MLRVLEVLLCNSLTAEETAMGQINTMPYVPMTDSIFGGRGVPETFGATSRFTMNDE